MASEIPSFEGKECSDSENEDLLFKCEVRKNRRKNLMPQKAVQSDINHISEYSRELVENKQVSGLKLDTDNSNSSSLSDNDFLTNISNNDVLDHLQHSPGILNQIDEKDAIPSESNIKNSDDDFGDTKGECHSYRSVKCNMCEQVFQFRADFDKHYLETYGLPPVYTCTFCNKTAEKYSTFRSHCYRHITEGRFKCLDCNKGFNLKSLLQIHVLAKHKKVKQFSCDQCGKDFVTKPGLRIHQKKHKTESKEDYPCVVCGKILHTRGGLTSHMNVHRLGRRFMCDVCGKTFTQKVNMQQHVKQHTGDKPHVCDKCGKKFSEKSHLTRHYSFHSEQRPFKCDICQKMYKTERCLKVHSLVHASERPFTCSYCNKGFLSSTKLKQHSNTHTGERPYKCKFCERTFTNYPNLLKHTRRKHKIEQNLNDNNSNDKIDSNNSLPQLDDDNLLFNDITLSNSEDTMIEETLINVALTDEKYTFPHSFDPNNGGNHNVGLIIPYFQNSLPSHQSLIQQINQSNQFTDLLHSQYLHQPISYE